MKRSKTSYGYYSLDKAVQTDTYINTGLNSVCSSNNMSARLINSQDHQELIQLLTAVEYENVKKEIVNIKELMIALIDKNDAIVRFEYGVDAIIAVYDSKDKSALVTKITTVINNISDTVSSRSFTFMTGMAKCYKNSVAHQKKNFLWPSHREEVLKTKSRYPTVRSIDEMATFIFLDILLDQLTRGNPRTLFARLTDVHHRTVGINGSGKFGCQEFSCYSSLSRTLLENDGFFNPQGFNIFYLYCALFSLWKFEFDTKHPSKSFAAAFLSSRGVSSDYDAMKFLAVRSVRIEDLPKFHGKDRHDCVLYSRKIDDMLKKLKSETVFGNLNEECKAIMAIKELQKNISCFKTVLIKHFGDNPHFFARILARKPITDEEFANRIAQINGVVDMKKKSEALEDSVKKLKNELKLHQIESNYSQCDKLKKQLIQLKYESAPISKELTTPPTWLFCPISLEFIRDPVKTPSDHVFERKSIEEWINEHTHTNPMTGLPLKIDELQKLSRNERETWELFTKHYPKISALSQVG